MNNFLLLKTLLLSTSKRNIYKYSKDKKKRSKIIGAYIGMFFLYAMLMGYCVLMCVGYAKMGMLDSVPVLCALIVSIMAFILTMLKTNGYLFNFKEYDMLMALPFEARTVAGCKFLYMYLKSLAAQFSMSVAMLIGYAICAKPGIITYVYWIMLSLFLPVIPMLMASFIGFLFAKISAGFKFKNAVQTVLTFILCIICFSIRYIIEAFVENDQVADILEKSSQATEKTASIYLPAKWFSEAVLKDSLSDVFLLMGVSILLFAVIFYIVGGSYRQINSALKSHTATKNYKMTTLKKHSVENAIAFKEFKRMTGSTIYMTNAAFGEVLVTLLGVITLIIGFDKIVSVVTQGAPFDASIIQPAIPFVVYFFVGMVATTACTPSLEGKNRWILSSLPINEKTIAHGKMLFNMYLTVPFMTFSILCLCISAKVPVIDSILYLIEGVALCAFSTTWGYVCGIKHMRLDWENEVEVVKQSSAVVLYMFPNMFAGMIIGALTVILGMMFNHCLITLILIILISLLAFICYRASIRMVSKK